MGFHGQAAPEGAECRWPSTFVYIIKIQFDYGNELGLTDSAKNTSVGLICGSE